MNRNHKSGQKRIPDDSARWPPFPVSNLRSPVSPIHPCQQASSLVTTLLVLVILSIIVVAFLQSMNVERNVARSAMNRYRAEQAADAGMDTAFLMLRNAITTNTSLATSDLGYAVIETNLTSNCQPILIIQTAESLDAGRAMPLVSGPLQSLPPTGATNAAALTSYLAKTTNTNASNGTDVNRMRGGYRLICNSNGVPKYNAPWIYLTDASGKTNSRVCFIFDDEQGKLNVAIHGTDPETNRSGWQSAPARVPVAIPGFNQYVSASGAADLTDGSMTNLTCRDIGQLFASRSDFESKKHLYSLNQVASEDFIPAGFLSTNGKFTNYPDRGKPKYNLNDLATNPAHGTNATSRATNIARIIDSNLPSFKTRDQAFVADGKATNQIRYVQRLAASMVDYIDADSESTVMADGEPAGKELAPVITSIAERYNWISETGSGTSWTNLITHTVFVQFWNPYQTNISGTAAFELYTPSARPRCIEMGSVKNPMVTVGGSNAAVPVSMQANEYKVFNMGTATNTLITPIQCGLTNSANYPRISETASANSSTNSAKPLHTRFRAYWNGAIFDYTPNDSQFFTTNGPGLKKDAVGGSTNTLIALNGTSRFSINYPQYGDCDATKGYRGVSDPRQNYLANYDWETLRQSTNAVRWNGRNNDMTGSTRQDYSTVWARRDFVRADQPIGGFVGDGDPTDAPAWSATNSIHSIAFIRNAPMQGLGELGNIYDPVQLSDSGFATQGGNPDSWYASGGGRTLRVGIPEYDYPSSEPTSDTEKKCPTWNTNGGLRATGLLDLFTVAPTNSLGIGSRHGKININTAGRDVLAALFFNLGQNADLAFTNSRITEDSAFLLADHVIANRPYFRLSDVWKINTALLVASNFSPVLGGDSATNIAAIMPPGRQQVLSSILDLIDVQSRCFRVIAIGQALDSSGRVTAEAALSSVLEVATQSAGGSGYKVNIHEIARQTH